MSQRIDPESIEVTISTPPIRALLQDLRDKMHADLDLYFLELESRIIQAIVVRDNDNDGERLGFTLTVQREERMDVDRFGGKASIG